MKTIPIYDATAAIACTASADEIPNRIEQVERMRSQLAAIERTDDGLLLHFPNRPDIAEELRRFTLDEKACCQFWGFAISPPQSGSATTRCSRGRSGRRRGT